MEIEPATKISALLKAHPAALEAIVGITPHFVKLRNPILRKLLASRVSIADAARIGGCTVDAFFEKLLPLGFTLRQQKESGKATTKTEPAVFPLFLKNLPQNAFVYLDVRESISTGLDPFLDIMKAVDNLGQNQALVLINTFEPTPLFQILAKRGISGFAEQKEENLVHTYFWRNPEQATTSATVEAPLPSSDFAAMEEKFKGHMLELDVRQMEMPQPMVSILETLERLPAAHALRVAHRRVPRYLLPQLQERNFSIAVQELGPDQVQLLIYKAD